MNKDVVAAAATLALLLLPPVLHSEPPDAAPSRGADTTLHACAVRADKTWRAVGYTTQDACFSHIAAHAQGQRGQGFRFATWGTSVLAIDQEYRYRSDNHGADWYVIAARGPDAPAAAANTLADTPEGQPGAAQTHFPPHDPRAWTDDEDPAPTLQLAPALSPQSLQQLRERQPPR